VAWIVGFAFINPSLLTADQDQKPDRRLNRFRGRDFLMDDARVASGK
jgi:hypothetical protein